ARLKAARRQSATSVVAMFGRPVGTDCGARAHARDGNDERVAVGSHGTSALIDRKSTDEFPYFLAHRGFGGRILFDALLREDVEHLDDQLAHLLEFGDAEAAAGAGGSAEAYPRRHRRFLRIERDAVLVAGDVRAAEGQLRDLAGQALGPQVDQP